METNFMLTPHRSKILTILLEQGEIIDPDGQATSLLMIETGHRTTNALSGVLQSMEQAGLIERDTAGRRTYRISLTKEGRRLAEQIAKAGPAPTPSRRGTAAPVEEPALAPSVTLAAGDGVDYDLLAGVLLKKALLATQAQEKGAAVKDAEERARKAEAHAAALEEELRTVRSELAELRAQVKTLEHNNGVLASQMDKARKSPGTPIKDLISATELKQLDRLMRALPTARGD